LDTGAGSTVRFPMAGEALPGRCCTAADIQAVVGFDTFRLGVGDCSLAAVVRGRVPARRVPSSPAEVPSHHAFRPRTRRGPARHYRLHRICGSFG
jgi:hypothetical protein